MNRSNIFVTGFSIEAFNNQGTQKTLCQKKVKILSDFMRELERNN